MPAHLFLVFCDFSLWTHSANQSYGPWGWTQLKAARFVHPYIDGETTTRFIQLGSQSINHLVYLPACSFWRASQKGSCLDELSAPPADLFYTSCATHNAEH